ncbi:hypothetical protein [Bacillus mesophilum]|uniref:Uncharacterized protein n=1 Tax=Bacillus mesophilum TaxID=1071718 RepID=A0A7V7RKU7_9BACI|nr:hypothetical protein [Bacillus mesophilum]KAB2331094.1 hypothetical protein F7732_17980 [Bacillus mesophilum]
MGQIEINNSKTRIFNILVSVFNQDRSIALRTLAFRGEQAEPPRHFVEGTEKVLFKASETLFRWLFVL